MSLKEKIKKIFSLKVSDSVLAIGLALIYVMCMLVLLRLTLYSTPFYDDYSYGKMVQLAFQRGEGFTGIIKAAFDNTRGMWYAWQGTFSTIFIMSIMPAAFGEQYYFLGPVFLLVLFAISVLFLAGVVFRGLFKADKWNVISIKMIVSLFLITLIYSAQQVIYWYNGGVHYLAAHSFMIIMLAFVILFSFIVDSTWKKLLCAAGAFVFAILTAGSNYVTSLQGLVFLASITVVIVLYSRKSIKYMIPSLLIYVCCFYINVSAPGNAVRAAQYADSGYPAVEAILRSFLEAVKWMPKLTGLVTFLFLILATPVIWRVVDRCNYKFQYPLIVIIWSFCVYATGFTPNLFATGEIDLARVLCVIKITYELLLLLDLTYIIGYIKQRFADKKIAKWQGGVVWWGYAVWAVCFILLFASSSNQAGTYAPYGAYYYVHSGEAFNYRQEYLSRVDKLTSGEQDVVLTPYGFRPWFICMKEDISEDPQNEKNQMMASFYDINSVRLEVVE